MKISGEKLVGLRNKYRSQADRVKIWQAIRALKDFTIFDVCQVSGASYGNVKRFVRVLELAGYLKKTKVPLSGAPGARNYYSLIRDTGPKAPIQKAIRFLYDPNTNEYWIDGLEGSRQ